jgi:hypothetical protein
MADRSPLISLWKLTLHVVSGLFAAGIIAGAAIVVNLGAKWVATHDLLPPYLVIVLYGFEYLLFGLDAICLLVFLVRKSIRFVKEVL